MPVRPLEMPQVEFEAWLRSANRTIGGSSVGAIIGVNRYQTPDDVWDGLLNPHTAPRTARCMDRGTAMEPIIREIYVTETGRAVTPPERVGRVPHRHAELWFLHATPDGLADGDARSPAALPGVLEIKCLGQHTYRETREQGIDPSYYAQVQHYIDVLGLSWGSFAVFNAEDWQLYWFDVARDDEFIQAMRDEVIRFWREHVLTRERPSGRPVNVVPERRVGAEYVTLDTPEWRTTLMALARAQNEKKLAETAYELEKQRVKEMLERLGHEKVRVPGVGKVTYSPSYTRTIDRARLAVERPDVNLADYERVTESRTFNVYGDRG
jgi:putative phage-type endonuclease